METILHGIPGVTVYIYDILVVGRTKAEHLDNLKGVLSRLDKAECGPKGVNVPSCFPLWSTLAISSQQPDMVKGIVEARAYDCLTVTFVPRITHILWQIFFPICLPF